MKIIQITEQKSRFMDLLLIGDEQESMILEYLDQCTLFALYDQGSLKGVCAVLALEEGVFEVKNLAVSPPFQGQGLGRLLLEHAAQYCASQGGRLLLAGTGEPTLPFYEKCGFAYSHRILNFFTDHYDHPIVEDGVLLRDMVYVKRMLAAG